MPIEIIQFREVEVNESFPSLCDELRECISDQLDEFSHSLIGDLTHIDQRDASYNDLEIESIAHNYDNSFILRYSYEYFINNGCSDFNKQGQKGGSVNFTLNKNGTIRIEIPEITNARGNRIYED